MSQRFYAVYDVTARMVQYPMYCANQGDVAAIYTNYRDAQQRRREFAEANPTVRFAVREVTLMPVRKPKRAK